MDPVGSHLGDGERDVSVHVFRLVEEMTDLWTPLVRHRGGTLVCDAAPEVPRRLRVDVGELQASTGRALGELLDRSGTDGSVIHLTILAARDADGALEAIRCRVAAITTALPAVPPQDAGEHLGNLPTETVRQYCVRAVESVDDDEMPPDDLHVLRGAHVLHVQPPKDESPPHRCTLARSLERAGARVQGTHLDAGLAAVLLDAAADGHPFDMCVVDIDSASDTAGLVDGLRRSPALARLPIVLACANPLNGSGAVPDDPLTTTTAHSDTEVITAVSCLLGGPDPFPQNEELRSELLTSLRHRTG